MKVTVKVVLLALVLLFALSSTAVASEATIKYLYYERSDGAIIIVNYEKAIVDITIWHRRKLYDATLNAVRQALMTDRGVWVETRNGNVIDYRKAIGDGKDYMDAVGDDKYRVSRPIPQYEMYLTDFHEVALRYPQPLDYPAWLDKDATKITWSDLADRWVIDIFIIEANLPPGNYVYESIDYVLIKGVLASNVDNVDRWRALLEGEKTKRPSVRPGDVKIRIGNIWYW